MKKKLLVLIGLCFSLLGCSADLSIYNDYCMSALEVRYMDDFTNYTKVDGLMEINESFHKEMIEYVNESLLDYSKINTDFTSGEILDLYKYNLEEIMKQIKISSVKCSYSENEMYVTVGYYPINLDSYKRCIERATSTHINTLVTLKRVSEEKSYQLETIYSASLLDGLISSNKNIIYNKKQTMKLKVEKQGDLYTIDQEDLHKLDLALLGL